jgi:hypothetical protein
MINLNPTFRSSYCSNNALPQKVKQNVKVATRENSPLIRELEAKARIARCYVNNTDKKILNSPLTGIKNPDKITVGEMALGLCDNINHFIARLRANVDDKDALDAFNRTHKKVLENFG